MSEHRVSVDNGKYTFVLRPTYSKVDVLRDGKPWVTILQPWNALHSALCELDGARVVLEAARSIPAADSSPSEIIAFFDRMRDAVTKHNHLCDDRESPSDWTK